MNHHSKSATMEQPAADHTTIITDADGSSLLAELLAACAHVDAPRLEAAIAALKTVTAPAALADARHSNLAAFHEALWGLRSQLDPSSVTMTSTNIPDAIVKLSAVLHETNEASQKVFALTDKHSEIAKRCDAILNELEAAAKAPQPDTRSIAELASRCRALNQASQAVAHEIVMAQEFQDLCGQRVKKVTKLLCDVECYLRVLLSLLRVDIPSGHASAEKKEGDDDLNQSSTDKLLEELGL